ncbi:MAG: CatB-related O-acetyltransferase [Nitrospiraceae bacterium]
MASLKRWLERIGVRRPRPSRLFMNQNPRYASEIVGDWTYGTPTIPYNTDGARLQLGRFCSIAGGVTIFTGNEHHAEWVSTYPFHLLGVEGASLPPASHSKGDVVVGHDVWIGSDVLILSGVTIGNGAVIAARAVVTKDIPPYAIAAGVPARVVKFRFPQTTIDALQQIAWWDWPIEKIRAAAPHLMSGDIDGFIARHRPLSTQGASPRERSA